MRFWILFGGTLATCGLFGVIVYQSYQAGVEMRLKNPPAQKLVIVTYPTFASQFGPAPQLIKKFKEQCQCDVDVINAGDSVVLLKRLEMKKDEFVADVVLGLDPLTVPRAKQSLKWKALNVDRSRLLPELKELEDENFVPFDWSPMTFIYRAGEIEPPHSLQELTDERYRSSLALQDPRTSTPGLQFVIWAHSVFGEKTPSFYEQLKPSVQVLSPSWAMSYGMFKRNQAKLVFTYQTSVMYHWIEEKNRAYQSAVFRDGHPYQAEFVAIPESCRACDTAAQFVEMLLTPEAQQILMTKNYMLPVIKDVVAGTEFQNLPALPLLPWTQLQKDLPMADTLAEQAAQALK